MGLCYCPKRQVTNQFCYEHRVTVCEYCTVTHHDSCVIQSYTKWLKDSNYNPCCQLCSNWLTSKECIRLVCYHLYHRQCLRDFCNSYPKNTAPAGFKCPSCQETIIPDANNASMVAQTLRNKLAEEPWAQFSLGLVQNNSSHHIQIDNELIEPSQSTQTEPQVENLVSVIHKPYRLQFRSQYQKPIHKRISLTMFRAITRWKRKLRQSCSTRIRIWGWILVGMVVVSTFYVVMMVEGLHDKEHNNNKPVK